MSETPEPVGTGAGVWRFASCLRLLVARWAPNKEQAELLAKIKFPCC